MNQEDDTSRNESIAEPSIIEPTVAAGQLIRLNDHYSYDPVLNTIGLTSALEGLDHEKLNRQAEAFAEQENARGWTVVSDYFATGEGRHVYYLRSFAGSESEARDDFRARFFEDSDDEHWAWVLIGLVVHRGLFWPDYLSGYLMPPDELEMHWQS